MFKIIQLEIGVHCVVKLCIVIQVKTDITQSLDLQSHFKNTNIFTRMKEMYEGGSPTQLPL